MKTSIQFFAVTLMAILGFDAARGEAVSLMATKLPKIGEEWERRDEGSKQTYSWVNFARAENDDGLSFCAWNVNSKVGLESSPVIQSSIEMFGSNGKARMSKTERGEPIADTVRHQIVEVTLGGGDANGPVETIEYTYVYGRSLEEPVSMCHGYIAKIGETIFAVQHTSQRPISSELAYNMISLMLLEHYNAGSYGRGEVRKIVPK